MNTHARPQADQPNPLARNSAEERLKEPSSGSFRTATPSPIPHTLERPGPVRPGAPGRTGPHGPRLTARTKTPKAIAEIRPQTEEIPETEQPPTRPSSLRTRAEHLPPKRRRRSRTHSSTHEEGAQTLRGPIQSLLSVKDAAAYMGVNPKTLYAWVAQGRLRCLRAGNRIRFRLCDLERWLGVPERRQDAKAP